MPIANLPPPPRQIVCGGKNVVHLAERMFSRIGNCNENTAMFLVCHSGTAHVFKFSNRITFPIFKWHDFSSFRIAPDAHPHPSSRFRRPARKHRSVTFALWAQDWATRFAPSFDVGGFS